MVLHEINDISEKISVVRVCVRPGGTTDRAARAGAPANSTRKFHKLMAASSLYFDEEADDYQFVIVSSFGDELLAPADAVDRATAFPSGSPCVHVSSSYFCFSPHAYAYPRYAFRI